MNESVVDVEGLTKAFGAGPRATHALTGLDLTVEPHIFEYHGEKRGDLYFTKDMLLAVGDRYEAEIAAAREADAPYR